MAVSMKDLDPAFHGAGQKAGMEIWRIENFCPVLVPKSSHGKFFMGDSYVILKTTASKNGALRHDIHYWLGKDTSQDEAGAAAIKTVELDAVLGGRAVQYREIQGHESEKFLSYFKPCIIPQQGGMASGFNHVEVNENSHETRLYVCRGKHAVHVKEVPFARSSLNHDDIFILDTKSKIFQFNGSNSSIQERAKALEVVQYIKDAYHDGKCEVAAVEDGKLMADVEAGEFWGFFGGFAPLPRKAALGEARNEEASPGKLLCVDKGETTQVESDSLTRELLETNKCYLLDCGIEIYVWVGKSTSLEERKSAVTAAEELLNKTDQPKAHVIRVTEGSETVMFCSKFDSWPQQAGVTAPEEGRGKVAALLKRQGLNVKGLVKSDPIKEEPQPYIDCTGNLQVWRVDGDQKTLLSSSDQSKFYSGDCYIFQYTYPGENKDEHLVGTWFGKKSTEEDKVQATLLANKLVESMKSQAVQTRLYEGKETIQFFSIFQSFIVYKGGISSGYKNFITENEIVDETYAEDGLALFKVQGSGPDNMQAIQVEPVGLSLNSSYCYILHNGDTVFTWYGSQTSPENQELVERQLDHIKPNIQPKVQKEGAETEHFWDLLGGKSEYTNQKIEKDLEGDPHLLSCDFPNGNLKVKEIFNFTQDDLMTEDIFILDCHSAIFVWVGQQVDVNRKRQALKIAEAFIEHDFLHEKLSPETPIFIVMEGFEPPFFTRFFTWDSAKSSMHGNSYQRKLALIKNGVTPTVESRQTSSKGRSPAFNALAATFENPNPRNLSTPPPAVSKLHPKVVAPDSEKLASRSAAIAALTATFEPPRESVAPKSSKETTMNSGVSDLTIEEDAKENEADIDEGLPIFPYERLKTSSTDPVTEIDITKREAYLSSEEFKEKFNMPKAAFYKLPKWKQNKLKMAVHLF
uniref:HP domain-containing protein n=1 Tax=Ananas comosus var. bracteatus TaxID=296719 RepID=A0A6V7P5D3_ANACO|nr:unnamed protein product [Ananas comosus var. bracteatus]